MSTVTIFFSGICTHIQNVLAPQASRVILPNGANGMNLLGQSIAPHTADLLIPGMFLPQPVPESIPGLQGLPLPTQDPPDGFWSMSGVAIRVKNPDPRQGLTWTMDFQLLPSLREAIGGLPLLLDDRVTQDGRAAGLLDINTGVMDAFQTENAVHTSLTVTSLDDPPALEVIQLWDQTSTTISLQDSNGVSPFLFISNSGTEDINADFLLSYNITTWTPTVVPQVTIQMISRIRVATQVELDRLSHIKPAGLTLGCSNSIYP